MKKFPFVYLIAVTMTTLCAALRAERGIAVHSSPPLLALTAGSSHITTPMTTTVPRANWECVGGIEAQQVVVGITKEVKQHLVDNREVKEMIKLCKNYKDKNTVRKNPEDISMTYNTHREWKNPRWNFVSYQS